MKTLSNLLFLLMLRCASATAAGYDPNTGTLAVEALTLGDRTYRARLHHLPDSGWPWLFELTSLDTVSNPEPEDGRFDPATATLYLPQVRVADGGVYRARLQLLPGSAPFRLIVTELYDAAGRRLPPFLDPDDGTARPAPQWLRAHATPAALSGGVDPREVKFLILGVDTANPVLLFQNSRRYPYHFDFAYDALGLYHQTGDRERDRAIFLSQTYFTPDRRNLGGSLVWYPDPQGGDRYVMELWPSDPVPADLIARGFRLLSRTLPFATELAWHPVSATHRAILTAAGAQLEAAGVPVVTTEALTGGIGEAVLNPGEAYGRLRIARPGERPRAEDIAIFPELPPNDLGRIAGIITEVPQTLLSHLNLRARQEGIPNAYMDGASRRENIAPLIGTWVHYRADRAGVHLEPATEAEARAWLERQRPAEARVPEADLSVTKPMPLRQIGFADRRAFGAKAANVAELGKILPEGQVPDGYAVPFALYDRFMAAPRCGEDLTRLCTGGDDGEAGILGGPSFYDQIRRMLDDPAFQNDPAVRRKRLKALRKRIKKAQAPAEIVARLESIRRFWDPDGPPFTQSLRCRSSTNNEDLPDFNGAGLYKSTTHRPDEGELIESVKKVWASLWSERAFETREFHRVDHFRTYMGVLIHPNYGDEQANGVAVTRNLYVPEWPGYTVSAQYGENLITNPEPVETSDGVIQPVPDEFILVRLPISESAQEWETLYLRHSNLTEVYGRPVTTDTVLTPEEIDQLRQALTVIHHHFKKRYRSGDDFAMEIEFKITQTDDGSRGRLSIKQARPWVR